MRLGALLGDSDRFEIEQKIGTGGMGEVFRARDRVTGEPVAVKVIYDARDHHSERFTREVELLSELSHPGIVRYLAHGETPSGELFLVMEWLDGEDLKARLERAPLTVAESLRLATRVAEALGVAHARGVVHRDLKPSNLFLPGGHVDQVKVLDFGIAQREGRTQLTKTGVLVGTPGYMAPEQARNTRGVVDARADVFALGCVLFLCLTGTPPFAGDSAASILGKILFGDTPRISELWPEVPRDLDALVAQMLSQDPSLRPSDGTNLASALAALDPPVHPGMATPATRVPKGATLSGGERRFLSVALIGSGGAGGGADLDLEALARVIKPYESRLEQLADGSTIVVIEPERLIATDQAAQAARCALAIHAVAGGHPIALAMGRTESAQRLPEGDVLDRAARLLAGLPPAAAGPAPVALDDVVAGLLDARFDVVERDAGLVLVGERPLAQGARTLLGRHTACVGRDWELGALIGILDECMDDGKARAVVVTAVAGMGKSRLATELINRIEQRGEDVAIWIGRGDSLRAGSTLDLLAQALRGALGIHGGEPLAERQAKLRARVVARLPAAEQKRVTEFLGELIGSPFSGEGEDGASLRMARQDAQLMSEQMRKAWLDFLGAETAVHPVLLVLEDLHWGDFGTVSFIDSALRERSDLPWMVLALARPEVDELFPKLWAERQNVQQIRLKELGRKAGERLVRQVLGDRVGPETIERLVQQAEGNAFYLEELIRAVAEGKEGALPETVLAMVETRLARLSMEARRVLRAASVFGEVCWETGVVVLLGGAMGPTMAGEWLAKLIEQEVLTVRPASRFPGERELAFRHALLREGAYATLTEEDKRRGHRLAGEWLEEHGEGNPMVLAGHYERGGEGTRAASFYLRAAEQAFDVFDLQATMDRAVLGLACEPPPELRLKLLGVRCDAACHLWHRLPEAMPAAEELVRTTPPGSVGWAQGVLAYNQALLLTGRIPDLLAELAVLQQAETAADALGKMSIAFLSGVCILDSVGQISVANELEGRFSAAMRAAADPDPIARFWWNILVGMRGSYAHEDPWAGLQHSDAIRPFYDVTGGDRIYLNMELFRGMNLWFLGALEQAQATLEGIPSADESLGVASPLRRYSLAWLLADRGALEAARAVAAQLAEYGHALHNPLDESRGRWVLAEVLRRLGDLDGAEREVQIALGMVVPGEKPGVLGTLAALRLAQGRVEEAVAAAEEAVASCKAIGGCGMFRGAFVHLVHAEALHATGVHDAARTAIAGARAQLIATADRIPDPAYRRSFLEAVPENARTIELARAWLGEPAPSA